MIELLLLCGNTYNIGLLTELTLLLQTAPQALHAATSMEDETHMTLILEYFQKIVLPFQSQRNFKPCLVYCQFTYIER